MINEATKAEIIRDCEESVKGPGKFEGEERFVPYFYDAMMSGGCNDSIGAYDFFEFNDNDREMFPELVGLYGMMMYTTDQGFTCGVTFETEEEYDESKEQAEMDYEREGYEEERLLDMQ